jgi:hypothetical protein
MTIGGAWPLASEEPEPINQLHVHTAPLTAGTQTSYHVPLAVIARDVEGWVAAR